MLVVLTATQTSEEAGFLAADLVEKRLAACVQIMPKLTSVYVWEGKVQNETEHLLLIKTTKEKFGALEAFISANHSYSVPEIVAIESTQVSEKYQGWLDAVLGGE